MLRVLTRPVYRRLFIAQIVALTGTGLATVALGHPDEHVAALVTNVLPHTEHVFYDAAPHHT